jgi:hypothetical protein
MSQMPQDIVTVLREEYGAAVRAVATYDRNSYTLRYAGDDVHEEYAPDDIEAIYEDIVFQELTHRFQEDLFDDMGGVRGKFRLFEEGTVAHFWPTSDDDGLFVALDETADPGARTLLDIAKEYYA